MTTTLQVRVDIAVPSRIKTLAYTLHHTQGEIIERAVELLEKYVADLPEPQDISGAEELR